MKDIYRINWETNPTCNEDCTFCFATFNLPRETGAVGEGTENFRSPLNTLEAKMLIDSAHEIGAKEFLFGGGDPFIRKDMPDLIGYADELGLKTIVDTNCLILATREGLLEAVAPHIGRIGIPFDGSDPKTNDYMRSKQGAYRKQLKVLRASESYDYEVKVNTIVTKQNAKSIPDIARLLADSKVDRWSLDQFIPQGRGETNARKYSIDDSDYFAVVEAAKEVAAQVGATFEISGGDIETKTGTVLMFSPQGVAYIPDCSDKLYIGSIRYMTLRKILQAATHFDAGKHMRRYVE